MPSGDDVTVRWDDGSDLTVRSRPGRTAFIDCVALYASLSSEQKAWVDNSLIEYAPSPCKVIFPAYFPILLTGHPQDQWLTGAKAMGNGLAMFTEGKEKGIDNLVNADASLAQTIPLVRRQLGFSSNVKLTSSGRFG